MKTNTNNLLNLSITTLEELVTPRGIYASSSKGEAGRYHALFGRDTFITASFIHQAEKITGKDVFSQLAAKGVIRLAQWQGVKEDPRIREYPGKIPHEIWEDRSQTDHLVEGRIQAGKRPFYIDTSKEYYVNYFSNDSTPLWIQEVLRIQQDNTHTITPEREEILREALLWCINNVKQYNGFAGYEYDAKSKYHEPAIQGWKDSEKALLKEDGTIPKQPIKDVAVNGYTWAALQHGSLYFKEKDPAFSKLLATEALELKKRFNQPDGFLMSDEDSSFYFSDALDGDNKQVGGIATDPALCLWAAVHGECIIDKRYIPNVVGRIMNDDIFDPQAGVRIYSTKNKVFDPEEYHRGENTYWPFISGLTAWGFDNFGYKKEAETVLRAMLHGVSMFNTCIEMFLKKNGEYVRYKEPDTKQVSSTDQAWTAGAVYYACSYLQS